MGAHLIDGEFQSDKYPTTPRGKVPLSVKDKGAQDLLWEYAQRRRAVDAEFADDLGAALKIAGYRAEMAEVIVKGECDCERCAARSSEFYILPFVCCNCRFEFAIRFRKGDPASSRSCPNCGVDRAIPSTKKP